VEFFTVGATYGWKGGVFWSCFLGWEVLSSPS
jgi:hypothetical protein